MTIRIGDIVSHTGALTWGAGRVMEVTSAKVMIHFSDGTSRKIAASHFNSLQPANAASYTPPAAPAPEVKARPVSRTAKKKK